MTTQPTTKCDPDLFENGRTVCVMAGTSTAIEAVVVRVREMLKIPLDWHYVGGRANVLTSATPDLDDRIRSEIEMALPVLLGSSKRIEPREPVQCSACRGSGASCSVRPTTRA